MGEWWCPGATEPLGPEEVLTRHEILLGRVGGHIRRFGRQKVVLDAAHVVRTSAGVPFRTANAIGLPQRGTYLHVSDSLLGELMGDGRLGSLETPTVMCDSILLAPSVAFAHMRLVRAVRQNAPLLAIHGLALEIVRPVVLDSGAATPDRDIVTPNGRDAVETISQMLAFRFTEELSLRDLASEVHLSPWYLSRVFRRVAGISVWQHVLNLRLRAAIERLAMGETDIGRLGLALGFSSHSHFTAAFQRAFGVAPSHPSVRAHLASAQPANGGPRFPLRPRD